METKKLIPASRMRTEIYVSNSKFIATSAPALSVEEAKLFIKDIQSEFDDATHNVPAYIIGHPPTTIEHSSDDGEPSGTAGRPILSILRGSGFGDIVVVVTRYFGGTKLGTGGLVRAYSDAAREILSKMPKAQKISTVTVQFNSPFKFFNQIEHLLKIQKVKIVDKNFGVDVRITAQIPEENYKIIKRRLVNTTNGKIQFKVIERSDATIMPL